MDPYRGKIVSMVAGTFTVVSHPGADHYNINFMVQLEHGFECAQIVLYTDH